MTPKSILRRKALLAAGSVVLALQGCDWHIHVSDCDHDDEVATDVATEVHEETGDTGDVPSFAPDCSLAGVDYATCCQARDAWCQDNASDFDTCYYGPGFDGSTGCIPWGPPAPPRLGALLG